MSTTANLGMTLPAGTDWADIAVLNANFELIDAAMTAARAAEAYSDAKTYAVGDYCTHEGALYRCTTAITAAEAWTAAHWKATSIGAEFKAIYTALAGKAAANHTHTAQDVGAAPEIHTHDDRYYTEAEVTALLAGKQDLSTAINTGNIGNQSVNYANSAGGANTVGGYSAAQLLAAAAAAGAKIAAGTYTGTGTFGSGAPCVLTVGFRPKFAVVSGTSGLKVVTYDTRFPPTFTQGFVWCDGMTRFSALGTNANGYSTEEGINITPSETTISWFSPYTSMAQCNERNVSYGYVVIG